MKRPDPTTATPPTAATSATTAAPSDGVLRLALRPREAARALGIGERLLWSWTNQGLIPHLRIGTRVVYPVDALRGWLAARTVGGSS